MGSPQPIDFPGASTGSGAGNGGGGFEARLVRLEERVNNLSKNVATKADIKSIKTLIAEKQISSLRWAIGTSLVVALVIVGGLKLL